MSKRLRAQGGGAYRCQFCGHWHRGTTVERSKVDQRERKRKLERIRIEELCQNDTED